MGINYKILGLLVLMSFALISCEGHKTAVGGLGGAAAGGLLGHALGGGTAGIIGGAIAGGLIFATLLTLVLTPSLLMIQANIAQRIKQRRLLKSGPGQTRPETPIQQS